MKIYVQIFGNPDDLSIALGEKTDKKGKWAMAILRGPRDERHAFFPFVSTNKETELTRDQALAQLREVLTDSKKVGESVLFGTHDWEKDFASGLLQVIFNRDKLSKEDYTKKIAPVLDDACIEKIMKCVNRTGNADTYRWGNYWEKTFPGWKKLTGWKQSREKVA